MSEDDLTRYELSATRVSPKRTSVDTGEATFEVGRDVNPIEYFLGSVLGCLNSTATMVARDMDVEIEALELEVESAVNYATYRGEESADRAGLQGIDVTMAVTADADEATLEAWLAAVEDRCPVTDNVKGETAVDIDLDVR